MAARVSKFWGGPNPRVEVKEFVLGDINKDNLVNEMLLLTQKDVTSPMIMQLFGSFNGKSLCHQYDTFEVPAGGFKWKQENGKVVSNTKPFITTFGIWIFNQFLINGFDYSFLFGGYVNDEINKKKFGKMHQTIIYALVEDRIPVETYKKFIVYCDFIMPWETVLAPTQTEKLLACTKEIDKMKAKLIKEHQAEIDAGDAAVAEDIEKQLIAFALEYLKDDPSLDGYLSGAGGNIPNNFKNMYIMKGAVRNPDPNAKQEFNIATSSFIDGISSDEYHILANSLTGGPYSRAKKTELGGYWEKLISYALNTVQVDEPNTDCGSKQYIEITLTDDLAEAFMYNYMIKPDGSLEELTSQNLSKYLNKKVKFRSVLFCKKTKNGCLCNKCAGNFFERRGNRKAGIACPQIATKLKTRSMKSFHDSTVSMQEINAMKAFGFK